MNLGIKPAVATKNALNIIGDVAMIFGLSAGFKVSFMVVRKGEGRRWVFQRGGQFILSFSLLLSLSLGSNGPIIGHQVDIVLTLEAPIC